MLASIVIASASLVAVLVVLGPAKVLATIAMGLCLGIGVGPAKTTVMGAFENIIANVKVNELRQKLFPAKDNGIDMGEFVAATAHVGDK